MTLQGRRIAVVGAGIGGLTAALALHRHGADVVVLEQSEAITEVGAGIQISPNGLRVLEVLGLDAALRARSSEARAVSLRDGLRRGAEVLRLDLKLLPADQSYLFVHRADIIDVLSKAVRDAGIQVRLLQKARAVRPGSPATVELSTGDSCQADLIVGADGLHSVVRGALNGVVAPFFTHQVAWRAVVPNITNHPPEARVHMGPGRHMVSYPLRGGTLVNIVAAEERHGWTEEGWHLPGDPEAMRATFSRFGGDAGRLLGAVEACGIWGLFRHPVARRWHEAGVALLGDAAHPTLPFMAQGANMALEDAWILARCLSETADQAAALTRYQSLREGRCKRVVEAANGNAWKYHLRNPLVRGAAHVALRAGGRLAPGKMLRQFDWIYGHDVTVQPLS